MKTKLLLGSVALISIATVVGVTTLLFSSDPVLTGRMLMSSTVAGLGSIGLFFVSLASPKN